MTQLGDNDRELGIVLIRLEDGRSVDRVGWDIARERLIDFLTDRSTMSSNAHWIANRAENILCAIFSGSDALNQSQDPT